MEKENNPYLSKTQRHRLAQRNLPPTNTVDRRWILGVLAGVGTAAALGVVRPWEILTNQPELDLRGAKPDTSVDKILVNKLVNLEASYAPLDLKDKRKREEHIKLCADLFAQYSGETVSADELVQATHWLSEEKYKEIAVIRGVPSSTALTDNETLQVYIREISLNFNPALLI